MPIGKEDIIQGISASKVHAFYRRWYRPDNMAVVAIGDFDDVDAVVAMIKQHMGKCEAPNRPAEPIPRYGLATTCGSDMPCKSVEPNLIWANSVWGSVQFHRGLLS